MTCPPRTLRTVHGLLVLAWIILWIVATYTNWIDSVRFVSHVSMLALVLGSLASWQAARVEVKQDQPTEGER